MGAANVMAPLAVNHRNSGVFSCLVAIRHVWGNLWQCHGYASGGGDTECVGAEWGG